MVLVALATLISNSLSDSPRSFRLVAATALTLAVLALDLKAVIGNRTFVSGPRRQAAKWLQFTRLSEWKIGVLWGMDAGSGISTYRITSGTWLFLIVAGVGGLIPTWIGIGYGVGFGLAVIIASFMSRGGPLSLDRMAVLRSVYIFAAGTTAAVSVLARV